MRVRIFHQCEPATAADRKRHEVEDILIDIEMPFVPVRGTMLKPTPGADYLKVGEVFWSVLTPGMVEAHICQDKDHNLYPFKDMVAEGWRKA